jgi:hypothetical protein
MAIDNTIRLLSFGMLVALSASVSSAQVSPAAINGAAPEASCHLKHPKLPAKAIS